MKLDIKRIGINGEGIAYDHKIPVFVKGALPEETVEARITENKPRFRNAETVSVIKKSAYRINEACPLFRKCGACSLLHCSYEGQLAIKKEILEESLAKYAGVECDVDIIENDRVLGYRNELKMPFGNDGGKLVTGLYSASTNRFTAVDRCLIHEPELEEMRISILEVLNRYELKAYDRNTRKGMRFLILRVIDGKGQGCIVTGEGLLKKEIVDDLKNIRGLVSLYQSVNTSRDSKEMFGKGITRLFGDRYLTLKYENLRVDLSVRSFYQLNTLQTHKLYNLVTSKVAKGNKLIVEAYSGVGIMSLMLHDHAEKIVGVEYIPDAVTNANNNAKKNGIENVSFVAGDAGEVISRMFRREVIDYMIVDPPRSGLDDTMLETMMKAKISSIVYVSCSPSSLSKNLAVLLKKFRIVSIEAVDMFSNTAHIETVVVLSRK